MHLKALELQGFKSFPDKTIIQFGADITAIVGPNGSGKSNISDAILWVMGEQSTKTLRGAKMEDVIFGGTQKRAPVGFAEATLILDNTDRALPYDSDEVMVTRRFYRSGDSEFYINRQSARLRDIHELFMDTGLGREGYSNVSQGRIDEILSRKSTDRREIFEEAAGISKYRHRKEETERKLANTEDNLLRIGDKIAELELQLEPLRVQSEKAKRYLSLKAELRSLEVTVWLENLEKLAAAAKKAEEDYASSSFVLEQEHLALDELYRRAEALTADLRGQDGQIEAFRGECAASEADGRQLDGQIALLRGRVQNNDDNIARIQEELSQQDDRSLSLDQQIRAGEERIAAIAQSLMGLNAELEDALEQIRHMTANAEGITRRFLELRGKESGFLAQIAGRQADVAALEASSAQAQERETELSADLASGESRRKEAAGALEICRKALREAEAQVQVHTNTIAGYELRRSGRLQRRDDIGEKLRQCSVQLDAVSAKARVYRAMESDYESYNKSVRGIMQESRRGTLRNIHGPVSRLIQTDDEFTTAIEIALGAAMQQIVVDSEADAKAAIAYLKRTNGGRATFLPLSAISGRVLREDGVESCRGYVGIASELVRCEPKYQSIIDSLLGRIVIAEDLDAAIAMAKKFHSRFKIVTLDGQVMNPGGSMTGGSVAKEAGILSRANELKRLTQDEQKLLSQKDILSAQMTEAQRAVDQTEYELSTAKEQLRAAQDDVLYRQGEEKQHLVLLQALEDAYAAAVREQTSLRERIRADRERAATAKGQMEMLSYQLEDTRRALESLSQDQSDAARRSEELTMVMTQKKTEIAALEAEKQSVNENIEQLTSLADALRGDREKKLALAESYREDSAQLEGEITRLTTRKQENEALTREKKAKLHGAMEFRAKTEADKTKAEREAQEKNKSILTMERACALLEQKRATTAMEERQVIDKLWDNYGLTPSTAEDERVEIESVAAANRQISDLKRKLSSIGTPNLGAIDEYARVNERYSYLAEQRDDVLTAKRELESIIRNITAEMTRIFVAEFNKIDQYFQRTFVEMFGGGKGALILENPDEPLTCGIEIRVQPPGKQLKTITLLSGGEKAFVAIALYFAILQVRPTPFCMLDEIDAALDDRNVERFAGYLHHLCEKTQFIVITHRRGTMEMADVLYGVTMQEQGVSKILHMDLNQMEQELGIVE
ncbi:MAG: chromosome segregation protein SMC [Ruminococcaceae bacterium]|nr:chromosome segregation protein SMC [Oscillospiraceae bacterium]